jgi:NAD(P)-dependent dehydrogenase (short-subunit alcohol dehydrogenase family)
MKHPFLNKVVVITGAGRGLGAGLCRQFGKAGAFIIGCDIDSQNLDILSVELKSLGIQHHVGICDVSNEADVNRFFESIHAIGKTVDVLINNAGITNIKLFKDTDNQEIKRVMDINFNGPLYCTRAAYHDVVSNKGSFVIISSVAGFAPLYGRTAYAASKHAVLGFFETLRSEEKEKGVHVLVACPGFVASGLRDQFYKAGEDSNNTKLKVGKNASPDEVAALICAATAKKAPMLVTGIGKASYVVKRLFPQVYEHLMIRKMKPGLN